MTPRLVSVSPDRIDTSTAVRVGASRLAMSASRINGVLGHHWTTPTGEAEAEALCLQVAEDALALRREIIAARKEREG